MSPHQRPLEQEVVKRRIMERQAQSVGQIGSFFLDGEQANRSLSYSTVDTKWRLFSRRSGWFPPRTLALPTTVACASPVLSSRCLQFLLQIPCIGQKGIESVKCSKSCNNAELMYGVILSVEQTSGNAEVK